MAISYATHGLKYIQHGYAHEAHQSKEKLASWWGGGFKLPWMGAGAGIMGALGHTTADAVRLGKTFSDDAARAVHKTGVTNAKQAAKNAADAAKKVDKDLIGPGKKFATDEEHLAHIEKSMGGEHGGHLADAVKREKMKANKLIAGHSDDVQKQLDDAATTPEARAALLKTRSLKGLGGDTMGGYWDTFGDDAMKRSGIYGGLGAGADMAIQGARAHATREAVMPYALGAGALGAGAIGYSAMK